MKKRIVFFDAWGTLWYPKLTKNIADPSWVFRHERTKGNIYKHIELTPGAKQILKRLKAKGIKRVIITWVKHKSEHKIPQLMAHSGISDLIDEYHAVNSDDGAIKAKTIEKVLKKLKMKKSEALMVGDFYWHDYKPVRDHGIDTVMFHSEFQNTRWPVTRRIKRKIKHFNELQKYLS